jgi:methyl-accepting chemotaxis protein
MVQKRKVLLVCRRMQAALLVQAMVHWLLFTIVAFAVLFFWHLLAHGMEKPWSWHLAGVWQHSGTTFVILLCLLPVVVLDSVRLSNRVAGPIFRLQRAVQQLARGEQTEPVKFREKDFWHDLADDFNTVLARVQPSAVQPSTAQSSTVPPIAATQREPSESLPR